MVLVARPPPCLALAGRDMSDPCVIQWLRANGYHWTRRVYLPWTDSLRNPTIGCVLEVYRRPQFGAVDIESKQIQQWARIIVGR